MDQIQFFKPWVVVDLNFNELLEARVSTIWIENINQLYLFIILCLQVILLSYPKDLTNFPLLCVCVGAHFVSFAVDAYLRVTKTRRPSFKSDLLQLGDVRKINLLPLEFEGTPIKNE